MSDVADMSESNELAVLRERVKNLKGLADYHREQLKDPEWRYQQAMEQLGASQRSMDSLTKALPAADHGSPGQRQRWRPFRKGQNREAAHSPLRRPVVPQVPAGIVNIISSAKCFLSGCLHQTGQNQEPSPQGSGWRCRSSVGQLRTATAKNRFPCIQPSPSIAARVLTRELARISLSPTLCPVKMPGPTTCYDLSDNRTVNKIGHLIERVHIEEDSLPGGGNIPGNGVPGSLWRRPRGNGNSRASTSHLDSRAHCHTDCHLDSRAHCHSRLPPRQPSPLPHRLPPRQPSPLPHRLPPRQPSPLPHRLPPRQPSPLPHQPPRQPSPLPRRLPSRHQSPTPQPASAPMPKSPTRALSPWNAPSTEPLIAP